MKRSSVVCWLSSLGVAAFFMVGLACAADVHVTRRAGVIGGAGAGVGVFYCASDVHYTRRLLCSWSVLLWRSCTSSPHPAQVAA